MPSPAIASQSEASESTTLWPMTATGICPVCFRVMVISLHEDGTGSEDNPANLQFGGVLLVGLLGAVLARFRAPGMARASNSYLLSVAVALHREPF